MALPTRKGRIPLPYASAMMSPCREFCPEKVPFCRVDPAPNGRERFGRTPPRGKQASNAFTQVDMHDGDFSELDVRVSVWLRRIASLLHWMLQQFSNTMQRETPNICARAVTAASEFPGPPQSGVCRRQRRRNSKHEHSTNDRKTHIYLPEQIGARTLKRLAGLASGGPAFC
jgi:hypothetical protein